MFSLSIDLPDYGVKKYFRIGKSGAFCGWLNIIEMTDNCQIHSLSNCAKMSLYKG